MIYLYLLTLLLTTTLLRAESLSQRVAESIQNAEYIFCIDGGGSKTELQVLYQGHVIATQKAGSTNIDNVGEEGIKTALKTLLDGLLMGADVIERSAVITGAAGAETEPVQDIFHQVFRAYGFKDDAIVTTYDGELALELVGDTGIILIAGTGSVCYGKRLENSWLVGGLGWRLGDEGSGYDIGIHAIQAALAHELGWGRPTVLTEALKEYLQVPDLYSLITPVNGGDFSVGDIAALAPLVFAAADAGDCVAQELVEYASSQLASMLERMVSIGNFSPCNLYFFGGTFKHKNAPEYIQIILNKAGLQAFQPFIQNVQTNPATLLVQKILTRSEHATTFP